MVFNSDFDNSLWLILSSDKKYRFDIAGFIYNLPKELYDSICNQLKEYNSNKDNIDYEYKCFRKAFRDKNGVNSYYNIEMNPYEIRIKLKRWENTWDKFQENINLSIFSISLSNLDEFDDSLCIGNYNYVSSRLLNPCSTTVVIIGDERNYELDDIDEMNLKISITADDRKTVNVKFEKKPQDFILDDLRERQNVNVLVKGRKKR